MQFLKKIRIPLIILILLVLVVLSIIIVRNILTVAGRADEALDFATEMPTNLDDIFTGNFLDEDLNIDTQVNTNELIEVTTSNEDILTTDNIATTDNVETVVVPDIVVGKEESREEEAVLSTPPVVVQQEVITSVEPTTPAVEKEIKIAKLILDKDTASRKSPSYITMVFNAEPNVVYADVKVFARRLSNSNEILSRDLVFALPRVYIVNGQGQTQFYFAGRYAASRKYIRDGRYIMYIEVIGFDKDGNRISGTGGYPMPKFDNIITVKN